MIVLQKNAEQKTLEDAKLSIYWRHILLNQNSATSQAILPLYMLYHFVLYVFHMSFIPYILHSRMIWTGHVL